jgi:hypothetical protein
VFILGWKDNPGDAMILVVDITYIHSTLAEQLGRGQYVWHRLRSCNLPRLWRWREESKTSSLVKRPDMVYWQQ